MQNNIQRLTLINNSKKKDKNVSEQGKMETVKETFSSLVDTVEKRIKELEEKERHWATLEASMEEHASHATEKITLDIGTIPLPSLLFCLY
jgi:hypothetical protein